MENWGRWNLQHPLRDMPQREIGKLGKWEVSKPKGRWKVGSYSFLTFHSHIDVSMSSGRWKVSADVEKSLKFEILERWEIGKVEKWNYFFPFFNLFYWLEHPTNA
ncbi:MAG: hypothetical protein WCX31_11040 [Salinivirgaceae bacterium]|jgi:hypothetical protein